MATSKSKKPAPITAKGGTKLNMGGSKMKMGGKMSGGKKGKMC